MSQRWLHIALAILVLAQPVASAGAWASMMSAMLDAVEESTGHHDMRGCHDAVPDKPDCCDNMSGVTCGMDCGIAVSAVSQPVSLPVPAGHGIYAMAADYASPQHPPTFLYKPPRTS